MSTTYGLIPGAGGDAWLWHRVLAPLADRGADVIAIDLPADDDSADLNTYADTVCQALAHMPGTLVLVAQSMGAFCAPIAAQRLRAAQLVLVNPMVPAPGEAGGQWWTATGQKAAMAANFERIGMGGKEFDMFEDFFHDVPDAIRAEALTRGEPRQSDTAFDQPWPLPSWPDIPTRVIVGRDDRLFPLPFQRRLVRERLGLQVEEMPGGHLLPLSQPGEFVERLTLSGSA